MQALIPTVIPCHAAADRQSAAALAGFLERGADVRVFPEEGEMEAGDALEQKAREARTADIVLVLFSRRSLPTPWPRAVWEDALIREPKDEGVRMAFVRLDDCAPPRVLQPMFHLAAGGMRAVKRWVRDRQATFVPPVAASGVVEAAELEMLGAALADRAGCETVAGVSLAYGFADAFHEDFDEVFRVTACGERTLAAMAGDLAAQLGLRLEGDLEGNLERLREFCAARRFLILLEGGAPPELVFGGRCSTLVSTEPGPAAGGGALEAAQAAFRRDAGWPELSNLVRGGRRAALEQGRLAECYELMQLWHAAADARWDDTALEESAREMAWILEAWGRTEQAARLRYWRAARYDEQMPLPFLE